MNIQSINTGWKLGMDAGEKKKEEIAAGGSFAEIFASLKDKKLNGAEAANTSRRTANDANVKEFTDYMKKSPAERMEEAWLKSRGITKEDLDAMSPEERKAILDEMRAAIEDQLKREMHARAQDPSKIVI